MRLFEPVAPRFINFGWDHGRFLDYWSAVHVLSGMLLGLVAHLAGASLQEAFLATAGIAALYEGVEILLRVSEDAENSLTDIIITSLGAVLAYMAIEGMRLHLSAELALFAFGACVDLALLRLGWKHYLGKRFAAMREAETTSGPRPR